MSCLQTAGLTAISAASHCSLKTVPERGELSMGKVSLLFFNPQINSEMWKMSESSHICWDRYVTSSSVLLLISEGAGLTCPPDFEESESEVDVTLESSDDDMSTDGDSLNEMKNTEQREPMRSEGNCVNLFHSSLNQFVVLHTALYSP